MKFSQVTDMLTWLWRRPLVTIVALLLLVGFISAHAETFGRTTIGTTPSGSLRADFKRGSKFTLSEPGTVTTVCAWLDGHGTTQYNADHQVLRFVIYRDVNGAPGPKMAETGEYSERDVRPAWLCLDVGWTPLTAGDYWLMIHSGGPDTTGPARYYYDGPANYVANADNYLDDSADPAGPVSTGNGTISIYAKYIPAAQIQHTGKMTVGPLRSGPLRGDFKRGSSFTLTQPGRVTAFTAYLDGYGAGPEALQPVQLALYEDSNGVPGKLVSQSTERYVRGSTPGRWYTFPVGDGAVHAGKYWMVIHTSPSGAARYASEGTGNWYGNADTFADGSSNPFGAGGAGDGTISAYVSYAPGSNLTKTLGYTNVGAIVQDPAGIGGLGSSYIEGSRFRLVSTGATLNGLYAYLDGLGGATGTQQARMVVFYDSGGYASGVAAVSDVLTISSGRPAGWVKFNVAAASLPPGFYWIALHSGPTAGIIRTFADETGQSLYNHQDNFADGPNGFVNSDGEIQGSLNELSVYATYTTN